LVADLIAEVSSVQVVEDAGDDTEEESDDDWKNFEHIHVDDFQGMLLSVVQVSREFVVEVGGSSV